MTDFIRVRASDGPAHEFDAPADFVRQHKDRYVVIDKKPVTAPRPTTYVTDEDTPTPTVATPKPARRKRATNPKE